jgi:sterol desaturase/sphingolipid hydroxylase (fatty acid hydroxylase superfamily)
MPSLELDSIAQRIEMGSMLMTLAFFLLLPLELYRDARKGLLTRGRVREMLANAFPLLPMLALYGAYTAFALWLFGKMQTFALLQIDTTPATATLGVIVIDFIYYWEHRIEHHVRALWALTHSVHHSSPIFNQTTALRISAFDGFVTPFFYLPAVLLGFEPILIAACAALGLGYQQWIHTETIGHLGWFDRWFNSPSNHRVHHGSQSMYLDKNFGGISMIWDRLFGTYSAESVEPNYGLSCPLESTNAFRVHFEETVRLWRDLKSATNLRAKLRLLAFSWSNIEAAEKTSK